MTDERAPSVREALAELWALWNDPQWCRMKADYMKGHLSYAGSLDEKERGIRAALATAPAEPMVKIDRETMWYAQDAPAAPPKDGEVAALTAEIAALQEKLNSPITRYFCEGVMVEVPHQRERWGSEHDAGKEPQDWFWLLAYLSGKALRAHIDGDLAKAMHHTISSAAVLANWHAALLGSDNSMRPGIDPNGRKI